MKIVLIISYTKLNFYLEPIYGNMYVNKSILYTYYIRTAYTQL